jgi:hypothetical protein
MPRRLMMDTCSIAQPHIVNGIPKNFLDADVISVGRVSNTPVASLLILTRALYEGADCSEKTCPLGVDPRLSTYSTETVTLMCQCVSTCGGRFKFRFFGISVNPWLTPSSYAYEIANALMTAQVPYLGEIFSYPQLVILC